jgi:iron complex outermembrane receptor protein
MKQLIKVAAGAAVVAGALPIAAQEESGGLEEITVTAQRSSQNVQDVPIAVTAISAEMLQSKGINDVAKLSALAPNVTLDAGTPFSGSDTVLAAYIRGIGQNDFAFNQDPGVGVYVDGVYLARSVGSNTSMLDVERVEILKGPQGTLFGRNTIGGAISIITREPGTEFMFRGSVTGGSFNRMDVQATADLPISDRFRTSLSFATAKRDGYQRRVPFTNLTNLADVENNPLSLIPDCGDPGDSCSYSTDDSSRFPAAGYGNSDREGGVNQWSVRGKAVFEPSDVFKLTFAADYQNVDQSASPNTALAINPVGLAGLYNACLFGVAGPNVDGAPCGPRGGLPASAANTPYPRLPGLGGINVDGNPDNNSLPYDARFETGDIDTTFATGNSFSKLKNWGVAATLDFRLSDAFAIKSITAYRDLHWFTGMDLDGSPLPILEPSFQMPQREISQELQLNGSAADGRFNYTLGAYYFKEEGHLHDYVIFPAGLLMIDGPNDLETKAKALFAHLRYRVTDQFGVTVGARYTDESKLFEGRQHDTNGLNYKGSGCNPPDALAASLGFPAPPGMTCREFLGFPSEAEPYRFYPPGVNRLDFSNTSPTVGAEYHLNDDMMLYASYSEGYKTGSWTTRLSAPNQTYNDSLFFDPEDATSQEIGLKSELMDRRLRLNLAAFHTEYDDIQLNSQIGISPTLVNAGDARIYGFEAEAQAVFGGGFTWTAAFGWTDAKYTRLNNVLDNGALLTLDSCPLRLEDPNDACNLPKTPEYKIYFGPQYVASVNNGAQLVFNADWTHTAELWNDLGNEQLLKRDQTDLVNASITYVAPGDRWQLAVGGTNLTDERYIVSGQNQGGVAVIDAVYSRPREWFATFRVNMK